MDQRVLQACLDLIVLSVFEAAAKDLDKLTETITSYISFCEDMCIPTSIPVANWLEHCVSSAKVVGLIPREHTY